MCIYREKVLKESDWVEDYIKLAKEVLSIESEALNYVSKNLDEEFNKVVEAILLSSGRVIVCGMGKSGIVGKKIAATLASTGTPSFFLHPGEAFHGDLGMVQSDDIFLAISNSGETEEMIRLLPFLRENKNVVISLTGKKDSTLSRASYFNLDISIHKEACILQLAPTSSTTATLAMGDALAVVLMEARGFKPENFAKFHPGGSLGRRLLSRVRDEMLDCKSVLVDQDSSALDLISLITKGQLGLAFIMSGDELLGIVTDGDLRRSVEKYGENFFDLKAIDIMSTKPFQINADCSMERAFALMDLNNISSLVVFDNGSIVGVLKK
jgi:arabinose-5-phosphate isomerase